MRAEGIRVNAVAPGVIKTADAHARKAMTSWQKLHPVGRHGAKTRDIRRRHPVPGKALPSSPARFCTSMAARAPAIDRDLVPAAGRRTLGDHKPSPSGDKLRSELIIFHSGSRAVSHVDCRARLSAIIAIPPHRNRRKEGGPVLAICCRGPIAPRWSGSDWRALPTTPLIPALIAAKVVHTRRMPFYPRGRQSGGLSLPALWVARELGARLGRGSPRWRGMIGSRFAVLFLACAMPVSFVWFLCLAISRRRVGRRDHGARGVHNPAAYRARASAAWSGGVIFAGVGLGVAASGTPRSPAAAART